MLIQDRIKLIIKANGETPSSFADNINVKRSSLSHVLNGRNKPSLDFLQKIITSYPNVNASWLISGETRNGAYKGDADNSRKQETEIDETEIDYIMVFYKDGTFKKYTSVG